MTIYSFSGELPLWLVDLLPAKTNFEIYQQGNELNGSFIHSSSIWIGPSNKEQPFVSYCERKGFSYGLVLMGDENLEDFIGYLSSPRCRFVVKQYFNPLVHNVAAATGSLEKLLYIRLPCADSFFMNRASHPYLSRSYVWSFAGQIRSSRQEALQAFSCLDGGYVLDTDQGFLPESERFSGLTATDYSRLLRNSWFVPCPMGWVNIDTQRVYESLDSGSIPVVLNNASRGQSRFSYWDFIFPSYPPAPFIKADTWADAAFQCKSLYESGKHVSLAIECFDYWSGIKAYWKERISKYFSEF